MLSSCHKQTEVNFCKDELVRPKICIGAILLFANNAGKKKPLETLQLISLVIVLFCVNSVRTWREIHLRVLDPVYTRTLVGKNNKIFYCKCLLFTR